MKKSLLALISFCTTDVAPNTIAQIIRVESQGNPLALNVNGLDQQFTAQNIKQAAEITRIYIEKGYTVDIGLMQINSSNFSGLGYSDNDIERLFEPCNNINAGGVILKDFYIRSKKRYDNSQVALHAAISAYNTGSFSRGIKNGYVAKVAGQKQTK